MYTAMEEIREEFRTFQRALRVRPFKTTQSAIKYAIAKGQKPFVQQGQRVVWTPTQQIEVV